MATGGRDELSDLDMRALRQAFQDNNRHLEQCQRAIDIQREQMEMLTSEMRELRSEVRILRAENKTLKQVNRLIWYLARNMSRGPYDLLCQRLEMDEQFREDLANLMQDPMNIKELTQEFLRRYPQYKEKRCCILRCLGVLCCCCACCNPPADEESNILTS